MNAKKITALLVALVLILVLCACGNDSQTPPETADEEPSASTLPAEATEEVSFDQPFHIIVPFKAGASADTMVRGLQPFLQEELGVPVVIENYEGGAYTIGTTEAFNRAPDGYSALLVSDPYISGALTKMTDVCPNGWDDWAPLGAFNVDSGAIMANTSKYISMEDVLLALKNGERVTFGNSQGSVGGIGIMVLCKALDLNYPEFVWYTGGSELRNDALGGFLDTNTGLHDGYFSLHEAGELRFLCTFTDERYDDCPDVPTAKEVIAAMGGDPNHVPNLSAVRGLMVNAKVAQDYPERYQYLVSALERAVTNPDYIAWAKEAGFAVTYLNAEETRAKLDELGTYIELYPEGFFGS